MGQDPFRELRDADFAYNARDLQAYESVRLTHLAYVLKSSLAAVQHMKLKFKSMKNQPDSKILLGLAINLKSGDIPSGPTVILKVNYTLIP